MASFEFPAKTPSWMKVRRLFARSRFNNSGNWWRSSAFISEIWFPPRFLKKQLFWDTVGHIKLWNRKTKFKPSYFYLMLLKSYDQLENQFHKKTRAKIRERTYSVCKRFPTLDNFGILSSWFFFNILKTKIIMLMIKINNININTAILVIIIMII